MNEEPEPLVTMLKTYVQNLSRCFVYVEFTLEYGMYYFRSVFLPLAKHDLKGINTMIQYNEL